jgi:hypothetical protein
MEVWWGGESCRLYEGGRRMDRLFVGVDISKDNFSIAALDAEGKECFSGFYSMDSDGFCRFLEMVTARCKDPEKVLVGMESTGTLKFGLRRVSSMSYMSFRTKGMLIIPMNP